MIAEHAQAILDLLQASGPAVYDGKVPSGAPVPYLLVYFDSADPGAADSRPLTGASQRHVTRAIVHGVGVTQASARAMADVARGRLLDVVPAVAGRVCLPIRREDGQPISRDETTGTAYFDAVSTYRLESVPA
jgi:hypothetical protein